MSESNIEKPSSLKLAESIVKICEDNKATDIKIFDVRENSMQTEFFVICCGNSDPHLKAIAAHVEKEMKTREVELPTKDGGYESQWVVLDFDSVMLHLFLPEARKHYNIEALWAKGGLTEFLENWECPSHQILTEELSSQKVAPKWNFD